MSNARLGYTYWSVGIYHYLFAFLFVLIWNYPQLKVRRELAFLCFSVFIAFPITSAGVALCISVTLYPSATFCVPALFTHKHLSTLNICNNAISPLLNTSSPCYFNAHRRTMCQIANTLSHFTFLFYRLSVFLKWLHLFFDLINFVWAQTITFHLYQLKGSPSFYGYHL